MSSMLVTISVQVKAFTMNVAAGGRLAFAAGGRTLGMFLETLGHKRKYSLIKLFHYSILP
jgi:hypothetical protein